MTDSSVWVRERNRYFSSPWCSHGLHTLLCCSIARTACRSTAACAAALQSCRYATYSTKKSCPCASCGAFLVSSSSRFVLSHDFTNSESRARRLLHQASTADSSPASSGKEDDGCSSDWTHSATTSTRTTTGYVTAVSAINENDWL